VGNAEVFSYFMRNHCGIKYVRGNPKILQYSLSALLRKQKFFFFTHSEAMNSYYGSDIMSVSLWQTRHLIEEKIYFHV